ncbi:MAG: aldehyde dehydrogenase family protein [Nanoarchaeota archaeon]|nr:aldehyde dehydrogenase family protein [Nanoarchaeota archaeon]MCG2718165.1 aldehyde dehydrogenase family protein [Nanoarchaeota archaeon]
MKSYKLFIGGKWIKSVKGETFKSIDPSTGKPIAIFQKGNGEDIEKAVRAAEKALPAWKDTPAPKRGQILFKVAKLLKQNKDQLAKLMTQEMGKVLNEAKGDVQEAIDIFEYMGGEGRRLFGHTVPSELKDKFCMTIRQPLGVVGLISPWNFPIAIPSWKIAPALICGNTVILKPSSDTPFCAVKLIEILTEAGVPAGAVNLVTGPGSTAGTALIKHPRVRAISFTGSKETGKFVTENAGLKKVGLELGGKNPIIIMEDANLKLALEGVLWGAFGTTGQRCTAASRVIIHKSVKEKFEKMLLQSTKKLVLGSGLKKDTDIGPLVNKKAVEKVHHYTLIGKKEGAKLLCGGMPVNRPGYFYKPTIFTEVKPNMKIAQEEIFGPTIAIIPVKNLDEAINVANNVTYGLSSSIYTNDIRNAFIAIEKIEAGLTYVNSSTIGSEVHLPFGGTKDTGNGTREAGWTALEEFSEVKTIYIDYSGRLQKAQSIT